MMVRVFLMSLLCVLWLAAMFPATSFAGPPPATAPATQPVNDRAIFLLKSLQASHLRLSTDSKSDADPFRLRFFLSSKMTDGSEVQLHALIVRQKDRVAILMTSFQGLPYCYMTNGLMLGVDDQNPGELVQCDSGAPEFVWTGDPKNGQMTMNLSYGRKLATPSVDFDISSLIGSSISKLVEAHYDPEKRVLACRTQHSFEDIFLEPVPDSRAVHVTQYNVTTHGGVVGARIIGLTERIPNLFDVTAGKIGRLPVKVRQLDADDVVPMDLKADYGKDERIHNAADGLASLFPDYSASAFRVAIPPHDEPE